MASWMFTAWAFVLGACLGSFYGLAVYRYANEIPMRGRSFCPSCKKTLRPRHLAPVLSWLFLRGRCGFCREPIGFANLFVECVSGLVAALLAARYGLGPAFAVILPICGALIVLAGIDAACHILPDGIIAPLAPVALIAAIWVLHGGWLESLAGGLAGAALLFGLRRVFFAVRGIEALGLGDVKLMLPLGFLCGLHNLPLLLLAASLSGLAASPYWLAKASGRAGRAAWRTTRIPFGPFLAFGCFISVLYGEKIRDILM